MSPKKKRFLSVVASIVLTLVGLEFSARVYLGTFASDVAFQRYATKAQLARRLNALESQLYRPHHYLGYVPGSGYAHGSNRHNSLGFRGAEFSREKPEGEFRIVCLGGSTTYTVNVIDHRQSFPDRLEAELRKRGFTQARVINAGVPGYTTWETLLNYQLRVQPLDPDLVVVYHGINDLKARQVWPPEAYQADNSGLRAARLSFDESRWFPESTLIRWLSVKLGLREPATDLPGFFFQHPSSHPRERLRRYRHKGKVEAWIAETKRALAENQPVFFRSNIENLVALCAAREVRILVASFKLSEGLDSRAYARSLRPANEAALAEQHEQLRQIARRSDAIYYDFAAEFPADARYFVDEFHVNEAGAALKAEHFARFMVANDLIPKP